LRNCTIIGDTVGLAAKNSLENYQGFSPAQLTFGENTIMPALYSAGPSGLEEVQVSKALATHINALHLAREAFIQCEADRVLKTALRKRVYARGENINNPGDWIYFKNKTKKWKGPVKVTTKDGKLLYVVRTGWLMTVNSDHAVLAKSEDKIFYGQKTSDVLVDKEEKTQNGEMSPSSTHDGVVPASVHDGEVPASNPDEVASASVHDGVVPVSDPDEVVPAFDPD
jgi:hypothetical protein